MRFKTLSCLILSGAVFALTACGGGGGNNAQQPMGNMQQPAQGGGSGGAPYMMTDAPSGWKKIAINGTTLTFEMPPPVDAQQVPETGEMRFISKQGKRQFTVGVASRNSQADKQQGISNDAALQTWADQLLQAQAMAFEQMKLKPQIKLTGKFNTNNAQGIRYAGKVGKADVLYIFYVTDIALYYVEVITQTPQAPETQQFINAFQP